MEGLHINADDVPIIYRFVVTDIDTGDQIANVTQYVMPADIETHTERVRGAMAEAYPLRHRNLKIEVFPA